MSVAAVSINRQKNNNTDFSCGSCPDRNHQRRKSEANYDSESTEVLSSTDEEERWKDAARTAEIPAEYYHIQKLVKYIKGGNQTATIVSLCCLKDYDLQVQIHQFAIQDIGGIEVLVNLLECNDMKCRLGSLMILAEISSNIDIRKTIVDLGGVPLIVDILNSSAKDLKTMAAETLANISKVRLARKYVRQSGGISKLVDLLDIKLHVLKTPMEELSVDEKESVNMASAGAKALWSLADSKHNIEVMRKTGIVPLMARLLKSIHIEVVIPIMGTIQKCSSQAKFQLAITTEGMIADIVSHLHSTNIDLKMQCSIALYRCARDPTTSDLVREAGGLEPLVMIIKDKANRENKALLSGATGAIWKCAATDANVQKLDTLRTINVLAQLLNDESDDVLTNVIGGIAECVRFKSNRNALRIAGGLPSLVALLNSSHPPLLENLAKALKECAEDRDCMQVLEELDAVRLIWSLLKNTDSRVQAYAAYAICPCVQNATNSGELVRSLVGAMELVVGLLASKDILVLSAVCAAIATIAKDSTNLAILTDLKVITKLAELVNTSDDLLRENLAAAIANCAGYGNNTQELGRMRAVTPIVGYMISSNPKVHRTCAMALEKLSADPRNCITMHQSGVVPFLLETLSSTDTDLQLASAGCLRNIRELALRAEEYKLRIEE
ncbi:armadillo repeat-containing protein gudu [Eupeodes corollae]|uniref:armadillo repeat-containing protein gudu n=1 Tax=Eupeodes corollae TaxID=290404 RepID=UPI00248FF8AC|nr:armadillo repeat-containing protein gudu [Eupeodes corollae]